MGPPRSLLAVVGRGADSPVRRSVGGSGSPQREREFAGRRINPLFVLGLDPWRFCRASPPGPSLPLRIWNCSVVRPLKNFQNSERNREGIRGSNPQWQ